MQIFYSDYTNYICKTSIQNKTILYPDGLLLDYALLS